MRQNSCVDRRHGLHRLLRLLLMSAVWHQYSATCLAQERTAAGVTVGFSTAAVGDSDRPILAPGFGGDSVGGLLFFDRRIGDRFSLGGDASLAGDIKGRQQQRADGGTNELGSRHRDLVFSNVLKATLVSVELAQVAAVVGAGAAWRHTVREGTFRSNQSPFSRSDIQQTLSNVVFAGTFGFDGAVLFQKGTALVFTARVHLLADDDRDPSGAVRRGVASRLTRFGGGARFAF